MRHLASLQLRFCWASGAFCPLLTQLQLQCNALLGSVPLQKLMAGGTSVRSPVVLCGHQSVQASTRLDITWFTTSMAAPCPCHLHCGSCASGTHLRLSPRYQLH